MADGRAVDFPREGTGWARAVGENYWLTREDASTPWLAELTSVPEGVTEVLVVTDNQGGWWAYTTAGVWLGTGAGPGRTISAHRSAPFGTVSDAVASDVMDPASVDASADVVVEPVDGGGPGVVAGWCTHVAGSWRSTTSMVWLGWCVHRMGAGFSTGTTPRAG